jgi:DNA repair protein RadC
MKVIESTVHELEIVYKPGVIPTDKKVTNSEEAHRVLMQVFNHNTIACQEQVIVLHLDHANQVKGFQRLSYGGISTTTIDIRLVLSVALKSFASGLIISHNHPTGNTKPSDQDVQITKKLKDACEILDLKLLDHVIVTPGHGYFSFRDESLI